MYNGFCSDRSGGAFEGSVIEKGNTFGTKNNTQNMQAQSCLTVLDLHVNCNQQEPKKHMKQREMKILNSTSD